jgi:anti-anti-sigma factor
MFEPVAIGYPLAVGTADDTGAHLTGAQLTGDDAEVLLDTASADPGFEVRVESTGSRDAPAVMHLAGELDSLAATQLAQSLESLDARAPGLVLDMSDVSFIDSSGLRTLIQARQMFPDDPRALTLRNPQSSTTRLLELTGLADYFALA